MAASMQEQYIKAKAVSPGIARAVLHRIPSEIGEIHAQHKKAASKSVTSLSDGTNVDQQKWQLIVEKARREIQRQLKANKRESEETAIFQTHLELLKDRSLHEKVKSFLDFGHPLADALEKTLESWHEQFRSLKGALFRDRLLDLHDVILRLLYTSMSKKKPTIDSQEVCIYSKVALPSCVMQVRAENLKALCCHEVSMASHLAILARSRGIPCLSHVQVPKHLEGAPVIIDGNEGWLIVYPSNVTLKRYEQKARLLKDQTPLSLVTNCTEQKEFKLNLWANIDSDLCLKDLPATGYEGIGLVRTEYFAYELGEVPTFRTQLEYYKRILRHQKGKGVVFRLFDFGSDKPIIRKMKTPEPNPALGCRGVRFLLKESMILKDQLRALLVASQEGPLSICVPMVCTPVQMQAVRTKLVHIAGQLGITELPKLGMMVEVPAAALCLDRFEPYVDFYSLGTNDLLQYIHAVDRANSTIEELYNPFSPALLLLVQEAVRAAKVQNKPISICGEMASHPAAIDVLVRLGVRDFSVSPSRLKEMISLAN